MCKDLVAARDESSDALMKQVAETAKSGGVVYSGYSAKALSDPKIDINSNMRQWTYQFCNEFGFFATPNTQQPLRTKYIEFDFWVDYCNRVFGKEMQAQTDWTNKHYGGLDIEGDNIFFLNGSEDPWQFAAMRELKHPNTTQKTMNSAYIQCDTCAHCVDFSTPVEGQAQSLTDAQNAVADQVAIWLSDSKANRE